VVQQSIYGIGSRVSLCVASVLCGSATGTTKVKDEFMSSASEVKFMNWDEKKNSQGKRKNCVK
jgi:hypothetical protein